MPPQTILFAMLHESGHLNPTLKLAKALRARGHDVRYLAIADAQPLVEAQGFLVEPLLPELFPPGAIGAEQRLGTLARRRAITARYQALLAHLQGGAPFDVARLRPSLLLIDVTLPHLALWARKAGLRFLHLNTSLPQTRDPGVPPLRTGGGYGARGLARLEAELRWARFLAKRRLSGALAGALGMSPPYELARRAAPAFAQPARALDWQTAYMPQLAGVPELVLCPQAFDFPRPPRPDRHHIASVDLTRSEPPLDLPSAPPHAALVYCAFGGQRYRVDDVARFFARVVRVAAGRSDLHLLLVHGRHVPRSALGDCPPNVSLVESAPQLAVLKRARLMITHGGLGSVKESILHGVPMLAVPLDIDQPGNAARIVHHGLGLRADVRRTSDEALGAQLDQLLQEPAFRARTRAMQTAFETVEQSELGVELVERALAAPV